MIKLRKKLTLILLALFILTLAATPASAKFSYNVDVYVNGEYVYFPDQKPFVDTKTNRTYVPIRFVAESLGAKADWDAQKMTAVINRGGKTVTVTVGTNIARVDNKLVILDAVAMLVNSRTMVPLRFVSEALGEKVEWVPPAGGNRGRALIGDTKVGEGPAVPVDVTGKGEPLPAELLKYKTPGWTVNYITVDDLKKNDYQIGDIRVIDLRVERDYIYVKQEQKNWSPIRIALWEGGDVYRSREASDLIGPPPVFESKFSVVNDRADGYAGWPTAKIEDVRYIFLETARTILAVANPLYKGGN